MADKIVITGVRRYEGEYDLDLVGEPLKTLEWRWIKRISGYLPLTVEEGWNGRDPDLFLAFAVIALRRGGKIGKEDALRVAELLEEEPTAAIRLESDDEDEDGDAEGPPAVAAEPNGPSGTSGEPSSPTSDPSEQTQPPTGSPDSPRSATSDHLTLAS